MSKFTIKSYNHGGIRLNVAGECGEELIVTTITAADSAIDLYDLFTPTDIKRIERQAYSILDMQATKQRHENQVDAGLRLLFA